MASAMGGVPALQLWPLQISKPGQRSACSRHVMRPQATAAAVRTAHLQHCAQPGDNSGSTAAGPGPGSAAYAQQRALARRRFLPRPLRAVSGAGGLYPQDPNAGGARPPSPRPPPPHLQPLPPQTLQQHLQPQPQAEPFAGGPPLPAGPLSEQDLKKLGSSNW